MSKGVEQSMFMLCSGLLVGGSLGCELTGSSALLCYPLSHGHRLRVVTLRMRDKALNIGQD